MSPAIIGRAAPQRYDRTAPRRLREAADLSLKEAAKRARIGLQTLRYLERGVTEPTASTLTKLAHAYGCTVGDFFWLRGAAALTRPPRETTTPTKD